MDEEQLPSSACFVVDVCGDVVSGKHGQIFQGLQQHRRFAVDLEALERWNSGFRRRDWRNSWYLPGMVV